MRWFCYRSLNRFIGIGLFLNVFPDGRIDRSELYSFDEYYLRIGLVHPERAVSVNLTNACWKTIKLISSIKNSHVSKTRACIFYDSFFPEYISNFEIILLITVIPFTIHRKACRIQPQTSVPDIILSTYISAWQSLILFIRNRLRYGTYDSNVNVV